MSKTLVLVRHAHRDTSDPSADNGLSEKGRAQAEAVKRFYKGKVGNKTVLLLSSPKRRCRETLEPLAEELGAPLRTDGRLLEGPGGLERRVEEFLRWWKEEAPARVVACSHGDWIPEFAAAAAGTPVPIKKGGWLELSWEDGKVRVRTLLQELP